MAVYGDRGRRDRVQDLVGEIAGLRGGTDGVGEVGGAARENGRGAMGRNRSRDAGRVGRNEWRAMGEAGWMRLAMAGLKKRVPGQGPRLAYSCFIGEARCAILGGDANYCRVSFCSVSMTSPDMRMMVRLSARRSWIR